MVGGGGAHVLVELSYPKGEVCPRTGMSSGPSVAARRRRRGDRDNFRDFSCLFELRFGYYTR